jgi:phospholipid/cholesterol/gamma-HCH transport system ATP-binding protein
VDPTAPVLDLTAARPQVWAEEAPVPEIDFRLMAGGLALIDARRAARPTWLADLCCGLVPLAAGTARFLDRDWSAVAPDYADALRGRIRRIFFSGSWIGGSASWMSRPTSCSRSSTTPATIRANFSSAPPPFAAAFGLPGLPLVRPGELTAVDLARAACARAFLGDPALVLLESPVQGSLHYRAAAAAQCIGRSARPRCSCGLVHAQ